MELQFIQIGKKVKYFRETKNLTQEKLAEKVSCSKTHIGHVEKGYTVSLSLLIKIANILEVTLDDICGDSLLYADKVFTKSLSDVFENCSSRELNALLSICKTSLHELRLIQNNGDE